MLKSLITHLHIEPASNNADMLQTILVSTLMRLGFTFDAHSLPNLTQNVLLQLIATAGTTFAQTPFSALDAGVEVMYCEVERFMECTVRRKPVKLVLTEEDYEQYVAELALCARTAIELLHAEDDPVTYYSVDSESSSERE